MKDDQRRETVGKLSFDALWAPHLRAVEKRNVKAPPPGEGWLTLKEFRAKAKCGDFLARKTMLAGRKAKTIEVFRGSAVTPSGRPAPQTWYRPK